jgi:hypothetical protein
MYSKLYYKDRIMPVVRTRVEDGQKGPFIQVVKDVTKELFSVEDEEIKAEIAAKVAEQMLVQEDEEDGEGPERTPSQYQKYVVCSLFQRRYLIYVVLPRAIDELPVYLADVLRTVERLTGLSATILVGGPIPANDGAISTTR